MLDKLLYDEEVKRCMACFEQQFHYGVFYAYMKLREQEIRNVMWISECVAQVGACAEEPSGHGVMQSCSEVERGCCVGLQVFSLGVEVGAGGLSYCGPA